MSCRRPAEHGVSDGTRTRDVLDHNQVLYQLSYTHHIRRWLWRAPEVPRFSRLGQCIRRSDCRARRNLANVKCMAIDLNADLGEETGSDRVETSRALLEIVSSANVACGGHAGDVDTMTAVCTLAAQRRVAIGAHISYPDREGFGRRPLDIEPAALIEKLIGQIEVLDGVALSAGSAVTYVKAHGALYNQSVADPRIAELLVTVVTEFRDATGRSLAVLCLPGSRLLALAADAGLAAYGEAFADRAYTPDGQLVPRDQPGAVITDPAVSVARLKQLLGTDEIVAIDGSMIRMRARSICIHSDTRGAVQLARKLRSALEFDRIRVAPFAPPPQRRTSEPDPD